MVKRSPIVRQKNDHRPNGSYDSSPLLERFHRIRNMLEIVRGKKEIVFTVGDPAQIGCFPYEIESLVFSRVVEKRISFLPFTFPNCLEREYTVVQASHMPV